MTSPNLYEEKEVMEEFISCYRHFGPLWNTGSVEYLCKKKKQPGYQELLKILRRVNPLATLLDVKRKINSLRCCYRRELKKIMHSGHEPRLWWFHSMDFLQPVLNLNVKRDNSAQLDDEASMQDEDFFAESFQHEEDMLVIENDADADAEVDGDAEVVEHEVLQQSALKVKNNNKLYAHNSNNNSSSSSSKNLQSQRISSAATAQPTSRRRVRNISYDDVDADGDVNGDGDGDGDYEELALPECSSSSSSSKRRRQMIDQQMVECDLIGQRMAAHFRNMRPDQRLFAERIISEVLVYGRMNRLSLDARFLPNGAETADK